jgi:hypothetical protein
MKYIIDKEVNLNEKDSLNSKSYVTTLQRAILNTPKENSFTIGLFGEWGSGKSSIVETAKSELESDKTQKIKFIIYDAWKYANDSFRRMFLLKIQESLGFDKSGLMNSFYLNESEDVSIKHKLNTTKLIIIALILVAGLIVVNVIPIDSEGFKISLAILISFIGLFATIFFKVFDEFKVNVQKPHLFAPEQFEECFKEMISKSTKSNSFLDKIIDWVTGDKFEKGIDKLVIVIDNIDRCNKELAYELLTDTKSFLGQADNIIFLIPVDDGALKRHIINSNACNKEAEEFLRKFFNVTIRIKPLKSIELFDFANSLNNSNELGFNPDTVDIVSREYASNPRRIIQFFNNLQAELYNISKNINPEFAKKNESLICKLLIIREEWTDFYKFICFNPYNLDGTNQERTNIIKENPHLESFLENTIAISKGVSFSILDKALSNGKNFSRLTNDFLNKFRNSKLSEIKDFFANQEYDKKLVLKYLIEELRNGVNSKRFKIQVLRIFNIILLMNETKTFDVYENRRIQNVIDGKLNEFLEEIEETKLLALYSESLFNQGINYLANFSISLIKTEFEKETEYNEFSSFATNLITSLVGYVFNEKLILRLRKSYTTFFKNQEAPLVAYVNAKNVSRIVTDEIFKFILSKIQKIESNDYWYEDILFIVDNKTLGSIENEAYFQRINALKPNFTNHNFREITDIVKQVNQVLSKLDMKKQKDKPQFIAFFNKIFANRSVNNRNLNLLNETINSPENIEVFVDFLYWSYRVAYHFNETAPFFNQIANSNIANRSIINSVFLKLQKEDGFKLIPLYDVILSDKTYNEGTFILLEYVLRSIDKEGNYSLDYAKLDTKIKEMVVHIFDESDYKDSITKFFEKMIDVVPFKESLSGIISPQSKDNILLLSTKLQHLAFDKITEGDVLFDYEDNIELLNAISESGEKRHKIKLANVIVSKIAKQDTQNNAFTILEHSSGFNKRDSGKIINLLEEFSDNKELKERVSSIIANLKINTY